MSHYRLSFDEKLQLIMECRKSGLSDRQWCLNKGIPPSTFYTWISKLRERACCDIPESVSKTSDVPSYTPQQDVVKVNIIPDEEKEPVALPRYDVGIMHDNASIEIEIDNIKVSIHNTADPILLAKTLKMLKGLSC